MAPTALHFLEEKLLLCPQYVMPHTKRLANVRIHSPNTSGNNNPEVWLILYKS